MIVELHEFDIYCLVGIHKKLKQIFKYRNFLLLYFNNCVIIAVHIGAEGGSASAHSGEIPWT